MAIEIPERITFLRRIHLFRGIEDENLAFIASEMQELHIDSGTTIIEQAGRPDYLYLIYNGKVVVTKTQKKLTEQLGILVAGDYFGEESLLSGNQHSASVTAQDNCILLTISLQSFHKLLELAHTFKINLAVAVSSRRLARSLRFKWLEPGETIYFLARKNPIILFQMLFFPLLVLLINSILLIMAVYLGSNNWIDIVLAVLLVPIIVWVTWNAIDWGNDYYIVTNQRVIWLEKVIGIYDSRQESPLSAVVSVGVQTDLIGRAYNYGDVIVRTFVGQIPLKNINHPYQAAAMIEDLLSRARELHQRTEIEKTKQFIRERMDLPVQSTDKPSTASTTSASQHIKPSRWKVFFRRQPWFSVRFQEGETITYRKHIFVLLTQTWKPGAILVLGLCFIIYLIYRIGTKDPNGNIANNILLLLVTILILVPVFLWWLYQYADWSNDIFQVTPDQIIDIDRKPLGTEERRSAPLENILSTESKRYGLAGHFINFGTVYITVGGMQMEFEDVYDPARVQQDIDRRRLARMAKRNEAEAIAERERVVELLLAYHQYADELRSQGNPPPKNDENIDGKQHH